MTAAALIHTDNSIEVGHYTMDLRWLQKQVGGYIEAVDLQQPDGLVMWCNEEGKLQGLPVNNIATMLFEKVFGFGVDYIAGDVVVCCSKEGDNADLSEAGFKMITEAVEECQRRARI